MPRIPTGFKPLVASFGGNGTPGSERTEVEGGTSRYALAYDRGMQTFNVALSLTPTAYLAWNVFYHRTIKKGSITFEMEVDAGFGCQDLPVNIIPGSYTLTRVGVDTIVSFQIELENPAYALTDEEAQSILDIFNAYGEEANALLARLAKYATVDSLVLDF